MYSDEELELEAGIVEFFSSKIAKYKWRKLDINEEELSIWSDQRLDTAKIVFFNLMTDDFDTIKKACITDTLLFHYHHNDYYIPILLLIKIDYLKGWLIKGRHLNRQTYLEPLSGEVTHALRSVNAELIQKFVQLTGERYQQLVDMTLFHLDAGRIPINKSTYIKDLVISYDRVEKIKYRGKERSCLITKIIDGQILLPDDNKYNSVDQELK